MPFPRMANPIVSALLAKFTWGEPLSGRLALRPAARAVRSDSGIWLAAARWRRQRRDERLLAELDARTLSDIGLLGGVRRSGRLSRPFWWLPSDPNERRGG